MNNPTYIFNAGGKKYRVQDRDLDIFAREFPNATIERNGETFRAEDYARGDGIHTTRGLVRLPGMGGDNMFPNRIPDTRGVLRESREDMAEANRAIMSGEARPTFMPGVFERNGGYVTSMGSAGSGREAAYDAGRGRYVEEVGRLRPQAAEFLEKPVAEVGYKDVEELLNKEDFNDFLFADELDRNIQEQRSSLEHAMETAPKKDFTDLSGGEALALTQYQKNGDIDRANELTTPGYSTYKAASYFLNQARLTAEAGRNNAGALAGLGNSLFDSRTWNPGGAAGDVNELMAAINKYENGLELSPLEQSLLDAAAIKAATEAYYSDKLSGWYKAGEVAGATVPYMLEFALTSGMSSVGAAVKSGISSLAKWAAKRLPNMLVKGAEKVATRIVPPLARGAAQTATVGLPRVMADAGNRAVGDIKPGMEYEGRENALGFTPALGDAALASLIDNTIEITGVGPLGRVAGKVIGAPVRGLGRVAYKLTPKVGKRIADRVMTRVSDIADTRWAQNFGNFIEKTQWHGTANEFAEEMVAGTLNSLTVGDQTLGEVWSADNMFDTFLGVALMGGTISGVNTIGTIATGSYKVGARERLNLTRFADEADVVFDQNGHLLEWRDLRNSLSFGNMDDVKRIVKDVYNSDSYSQEEKTALLKYAAARVELSAALGVKEGVDDGKDILLNLLSDEYLEGLADGSPEGAIAADNELTTAEGRLRQFYNIAPDESVETFLSGYELDEEGQALYDNYRLAKARFEGESDAVNAVIEEDYKRSDDAIDARSNNGNVFSTTFDGEEVFITGGDVVLNEDGTIDYDKSSDILYILQPDGTKKQIPADRLDGEVAGRNADELKMEGRAKIDKRWRAEIEAVEAGVQTESAVADDATDNGTPKESEANVATTGYNVAPVELPEVPDFFRLGGKNYSVASRNADGSVDVMADGKRETLPAGTDYSSIMPTDKKGDISFTDMPVERTHEYFVQRVTNDRKRAEMIENNRKKAEAERKRFDKEPDAGLDPDKWEEVQQKWEEGKKAAQAKVDYWNEVAKREEDITRSRMKESYESVQPSEVVEMTPDEFIANHLPKITPESFKRETGLSNVEQQKLVGLISNEGVTVEQAAESILENYDSELRGLGFTGDVQDVRNMIIDVLGGGNPRSYAKSGLEQRKAENVDQQRAQMEVIAVQLGFETIDDMIAYEESVLPRIVAEHRDFDETEYYNNLAENYENDTTRESESTGRGGELLQGEQSVPAGGTPVVGQRREGGAVSDDVQGGGQNGVAQEEVPVNELVGNSEQLSSSEIPNNPTISQTSDQVGDQVAEGDAPGQSGVDPRNMSYDERAKRGDMLRNAPAVDVNEGVITSTKELSARKAAEKWWDENVTEPAFYDTEIGEVEISRNSVESSLAHRYGQAKLDALTSLIEGFENAVYLGSMPDGTRHGSVMNHYFAYPINYKGERCYVFCRAMHDANKNRLYVHEVFIADRIKKGDTLQTAASQLHGGIALYKDILANVLDLEPTSASEDTTQSANSQENRQENAGNSTLEQIKAELKDLRKKIAVNGNKLRRMLYMPKYMQLTADLRNMNSLLTTVTAEQAKEEYGIDINKWDEVKYDALWAERDQLKQQIKAAEERLKNAESRKEKEESTPEIQEPRSVEEMLDNGDKRITNYNSRGEVATVAIERDGKVVSVDSYDEGVLFEHTEYDGNGKATSVTRYDKSGNVVGTQKYVNGIESKAFVKETMRTAPLRARAEKWMKDTGVPVRLIGIGEDITNSAARRAIEAGEKITGWIDNDEVVLYLPNIRNAKEIDDTFVHEVVAHKGLKALMGEDFDALCDKVWDMMSEEQRAYYLGYPGVNGDTRKAADEFMAHLAEGVDLTDADKTIWNWIVDVVRALLAKSGFKLSNRDIENLIKASYANLKSTEQRAESKEGALFRTTFHGSGAQFDRFDHSFMGTGEGAQAFGWGTYVTEVEGIGRTYATMMRDKAISDKHRENAIINNLARQVLASNNGDKNAALEELRNLLNESWSDKKRVKAEIKIIETGKFLPESKVKANLYSVEIPDDNGSNYLHWEDVVPKKVETAVKERLLERLSEGQGEAYKSDLKQELDDVFRYSDFDGASLYKNISAYLGGDKQASLFLSDMGFVGISYPANATTGGRADGARNYVIFNENDAEIKDRTMFRIAEVQAIEEADKVFNEELDAFKEKSHKGLLHLGSPMRILLSAGVTAEELTLSPTVLFKHLKKQGLTTDDLKGLAKAIQTPILVYEHGENYPNIVVVTELDVKGGKLSIALELDNSGNVVEVSNVSSVHSKDAVKELERLSVLDEETLNRNLRWVEKEKVSEWLGLPYEEERQDANPKLISVANVINNFENPTVESENSSENPQDAESGIRFRKVTDPLKVAELEAGEKMKVYRAMQVIDGKLYPPMSAKVDGKLREPIELGVWEEAEERPELADDKGYFRLDKGNKKSLKARYNPYIHTSTTPLNDQFSEAQERPNLVTVEVEIPVSELTSGYKAEKAKDAVGRLEWKAGVVQGKLSGTRTVILSRWDKPVRIVPDSEVADVIVEMFGDREIVMPSNVVTPSLRAELEKRGVPFVETNNQGKPVSAKPMTKEEARQMVRELIVPFAKELREEQERAQATEDSGIRFRIANENQGIFVSNAQRAVEGIQQNKATAEQWIAMLKKNGGLKAGEEAWLGLEEWLNEKQGAVAKQEILDFIGENKIQIEEVEYEDLGKSIDYELAAVEGNLERARRDLAYEEAQVPIAEKWLQDSQEEYDSFLSTANRLKTEYGENSPEYRNYIFYDSYTDVLANAKRALENAKSDVEYRRQQIAELEKAVKEKQNQKTRGINRTRLDYTTDGLENKREIALVVPTIEPYNASDEIHFGDAGEGRAVAWVRFGETTDSEGNRVLVIDEIQSKRHQEGREKGYRGVGLAKEVLAAEEEVRKTNRELTAYREPLKEKYNFKELGGSMSERLKNFDAMLSEEERITMDALGQARNEAEKRLQELREQEKGIPSAPFEKNWHELAMKRMLRLAAEEGFDKVAWTTGEQQAQRYNIGAVVNRIESNDTVDYDSRLGVDLVKQVVLFTRDGNDITLRLTPEGIVRASSQYNGHHISDIVGKELGNRIMTETDLVLKEQDLRIGGEGMKGFYDRMLPSFVQKYTKKWGAKVGEVTMPSLEENNTMWSVDVTPEMQESVMQGQTMFRMVAYDKAVQIADEFANTHKGATKRVVISKGKEALEQQMRDAGFTDYSIEVALKNYEGEENPTDGAYYVSSDGIVIYDAEDLNATLWHENAHRAIKKMFGDDLSELQRVYNELPDGVKEDIANKLKAKSYSEEDFPEEAVCYFVEEAYKNGLLNNGYSLAYIVEQVNLEMKDFANFAQELINYIDYGRKGIEREGSQFAGKFHIGQQLPERNGESYENGRGADATEGATEPYSNGRESTRFRTTEEVIDRQEENEADIARFDVSSLGERLNIPVRVAEAVPGNRRNRKGWLDNGAVTVALQNVASAEEAAQTVIHVAVGHKGLSGVLGERFNELLDGVYKGATPGVKRAINDRFFEAIRNGRAITIREATERVIADSEVPGVKELLRGVVRDVTGVELPDGELRYLLWKNVHRGADGVVETVLDRAKEAETGTGDVRFRRAESVTDAYNRGVKGFKNSLKEGWYDEMRSIKVAQEAIENELGRELLDSENVYLYANHLPSINKNKKEVFDNKYLKPFIALLNELYKVKGAQLDQKSLERYANAKHGIERNREMAVKRAMTEVQDGKRVFNEKAYEDWVKERDEIRKKALPWGEEQRELDRVAGQFGARIKDYSGLTAIFDPEGNMKYSQIAQMAYRFVVDVEFAAKEKINEFWKLINGMTRYSLNEAFDSGLMSEKVFKHIGEMYRYYVPLRGFTEQTAEDFFEYVEGDHSPLNAVVKTAQGRTSEAENIFATIFNMANSAIVQGSKNRLKQRLLNLALRGKTDLLSVDNAWYKKEGDEYFPVQSYPDDAKGFAEFERRMKEAEKNGEVTRHRPGLNIGVKVAEKWNEKQHAVRVKRNGKEYVIWVNGEPKLANAVNGLLRENFDNTWVGGINRFRAKMVTQYSPTFVFTNLLRDVQSASMIYAIRRGSAALGRFEGNVFKNLPKMMSLYKKHKAGTLDVNVPIERYFKEFLENGGETGYTEMITIEEYDKRIKKLTKDLNIMNATGRGLNAFGEMVDFANRCVENLCRFSAYQTSREMGVSILKSIEDAKEVSVNFNRKGSGAMGQKYAKAGFMFLNPAVQSMAQRILLWKKYPKKMTAVLAGEFIMGAAMPTLYMIISAAIGDEDELEGNYFNLSDYRRRSNICIPVIDGVLHIPLSHEARVAYGLGELITSTIMGHEEFDNFTLQAFNVIAQALPLNPMEGWKPGDNILESLAYNLAPDVIKPIVEAGFNRDFAGNKIHNRSDFNEHLPEYMRGKRGTAGMYKVISELLSGKEIYGKSWADELLGSVVNPSVMEHLVRGYLGGAYTFAENLFKTGAWVAGDEEFAEFRNVPIASSFYTSLAKYEDNPEGSRTRRDWEDAFRFYSEEVRYYNNKEKAAKAGEKYGEESGALTLEQMERNGELVMIDIFNDGNDRLKELYGLSDAARRNGDFDRVNELSNEIYAEKRNIVSLMEQLADNPVVGYTFKRNKLEGPYGERETYGDVRDANIINDMQAELEPVYEEHRDDWQGYEREFDLWDALDECEDEIGKLKRTMKNYPEEADECMTEIRELRAEAIGLINNYRNNE